MVYFYVPSQQLVNQVPQSLEEYWDWISEAIRETPAQCGEGNRLCTWAGPYNWTIQTYIYLRMYGFPCKLTASLPKEGIIITHGDFLPRFFRPSAGQFIVEIKPDRSLQCAYANFVIVQNRHDPICSGRKRLSIKSAFVKYWPQPGLIPRDARRGERFENICYMGNPEQFLHEVNILAGEIKKIGLNWRMMPRERWNDYSDVDAIIAVRPFESSKTRNPLKRLFRRSSSDTSPILSLNRKPASKLCNAWLAGTPAILSPDIAFEDLRNSGLDYLEARNVTGIIERLKLLKSDPILREAMIENGKKRAGECASEQIVQDWIKIIEERIIPAFTVWKESPLRRHLFFLLRTGSYAIMKSSEIIYGILKKRKKTETMNAI
jgi:hypothetical protein